MTKEKEAMKALNALYLAVNEDIVDDLIEKFTAAIKEAKEENPFAELIQKYPNDQQLGHQIRKLS